MKPAAILTVVLVTALVCLLYYSMDLGARGEYGAEFLWTTSSLVVVGIGSMVLLSQVKPVAA